MSLPNDVTLIRRMVLNVITRENEHRTPQIIVNRPYLAWGLLVGAGVWS